MSKMQRFIRALINNGFSQWENYDLLRADPDGYIYIQERTTKREFKLHVESSAPVMELKYEPAKDILFDPNKKPIIVNLEERIKQQSTNDNSMEETFSDMEKTLSNKEILKQEVERLKKAQEEELLKVMNNSKVQEDVDNTISRPRGWRLMGTFVDPDGTVYLKGVEHPELKGTLPPTK
jgi:hypothetical protein